MVSETSHSVHSWLRRPLVGSTRPLAQGMSHAGTVTITEDPGTSGGGQVHLIAAADLEAIVRAIFTAAGCADEEASLIARELLGANLAGHDSHGVVRVPLYVDWMREGW